MARGGTENPPKAGAIALIQSQGASSAKNRSENGESDSGSAKKLEAFTELSVHKKPPRDSDFFPRCEKFE